MGMERQGSSARIHILVVLSCGIDDRPSWRICNTRKWIHPFEDYPILYKGLEDMPRSGGIQSQRITPHSGRDGTGQNFFYLGSRNASKCETTRWKMPGTVFGIFHVPVIYTVKVLTKQSDDSQDAAHVDRAGELSKSMRSLFFYSPISSALAGF